MFILQGPCWLQAGAGQCSWDRVSWHHTMCCEKPRFFSSLLGVSLGNVTHLAGRPCCTVGRMKRRVVFLHLCCNAFSGFVGFSRVGVLLSPPGSAWDSPLVTSPVLEHHLSTAGRFHGDHSRASLHGYSGTLAVGQGADAGAWGTCPSQDKWPGVSGAGNLGTSGHRQQLEDSLLLLLASGHRALLLALSEASPFPVGTGTKPQPH